MIAVSNVLFVGSRLTRCPDGRQLWRTWWMTPLRGSSTRSTSHSTSRGRSPTWRARQQGKEALLPLACHLSDHSVVTELASWCWVKFVRCRPPRSSSINFSGAIRWREIDAELQASAEWKLRSMSLTAIGWTKITLKLTFPDVDLYLGYSYYLLLTVHSEIPPF